VAILELDVCVVVGGVDNWGEVDKLVLHHLQVGLSLDVIWKWAS
jgi:hypothetical protein